MLTLEPLFAPLGLPPSSGGEQVLVSAAPIPGHEQFRIAKDATGRALILAGVAGGPNEPLPPLVLEHLRLEPARPCRVRRTDGTVEQGIFTVVTCDTHDVALRSYFLMVAGLIVESSTERPNSNQLRDKVEAFVELFRAMQQPARKPTQGLWAELALILWSRTPETLLRAWHAQPDERFDFSLGRHRVEVKSTVGPQRRHHFSQSQLDAPQGTRGIIASMFVERAGGGVSIRTMMDRIGSLVLSQPDLLLRLEAVVVATLGSSLRSSSAESFDLERARESLRFFDVHSVPRILSPIPQAVTDVRFVADLAGVPSADLRTTSSDAAGTLISCLPEPR